MVPLVHTSAFHQNIRKQSKQYLLNEFETPKGMSELMKMNDRKKDPTRAISRHVAAERNQRVALKDLFALTGLSS